MLLEQLKIYEGYKPDYSSDFYKKINQIAECISKEINSFIHVNRDMNYSVGQSINCYFNVDWTKPLSIQTSKYCIKIWVSSKIPSYCIKTFEQNANRWILKKIELPNFLEIVIDEIMKKENYFEFPSEYLNNVSDIHVTEMDNKPANYFEVFFSEIE